MGPRVSFAVYVLAFRRCGKNMWYVGITGVHREQSVRSALLVRKAWHVAQSVSWVSGYEHGTLQISPHVTGLRLAEALAAEALLTAEKYQALGSDVVRGGAWLRRRLTHDDKLEIEAVALCESRQGVWKVLEAFPAGSLAAHLQSRPFGAAPSPSAAARPLVLPMAKRQSGKHKPGPRPSGQHKSGTRPSSGISGASLSGACKRFLRLPLAVCKRPAACSAGAA